MTARLYLDDCISSRALQRTLEDAGFQLVHPADVGLRGAHDEQHFQFACQERLLLLTGNPRDFVALHERHPDHPGVLLVYADNDPTKDMSSAEIAGAIARLLASGLPIAGQIHVLNHWRS